LVQVTIGVVVVADVVAVVAPLPLLVVAALVVVVVDELFPPSAVLSTAVVEHAFTAAAPARRARDATKVVFRAKIRVFMMLLHSLGRPSSLGLGT
jgi:hypothetical protein